MMTLEQLMIAVDDETDCVLVVDRTKQNVYPYTVRVDRLSGVVSGHGNTETKAVKDLLNYLKQSAQISERELSRIEQPPTNLLSGDDRVFGLVSKLEARGHQNIKIVFNSGVWHLSFGRGQDEVMTEYTGATLEEVVELYRDAIREPINKLTHGHTATMKLIRLVGMYLEGRT